MIEDTFIEKFNNIIQADIDVIKHKIDKEEKKLSILASILLILLLGTLFLTNHFNLNILFFIMALFSAIMIYYTGTYAFRYEYTDILEKDIFTKIVQVIIKDGHFFTYKNLLEDAKKSNIFFIYNFIIASAIIYSKWAIQFFFKQKEINISSTYIDISDIINPAIPFSEQNRGLFITIKNVNLFNSEIYIFENKLIPSFVKISNILKKDFSQDTSLHNEYTVLSKPLDTQSKNKLTQILNLFKQNIMITLKENVMYIFIHKEFTCFDAGYYTNGTIPSYSDYTEFLKVTDTLQQIIEILEK